MCLSLLLRDYAWKEINNMGLYSFIALITGCALLCDRLQTSVPPSDLHLHVQKNEGCQQIHLERKIAVEFFFCLIAYYLFWHSSPTLEPPAIEAGNPISEARDSDADAIQRLSRSFSLHLIQSLNGYWSDLWKFSLIDAG